LRQCSYKTAVFYIYTLSQKSFHFDVFIVISMWFCVGTPNFMQIGTPVDELWRHSDFQDGGHHSCWICCGVMVDHPRSVGGCCYVLKFWLDRIYSFGDSVIFRFSRLAWICLFTPSFRRFLRHISPKWHNLSSYPQKTPPHVVWAIKRDNRSSGTTCARDLEKRTGQSKKSRVVPDAINNC